jgi:hypothetical protein
MDKELKWAADMGYSYVRVFLPYLVWENDPKGLKERVGEFLGLASKHGLKTVPVLFDDYSPMGRDPYLGKQDAPIPGIHNGQWTPSPGHARVVDPGAWPKLEAYVKDAVGGFRGDRRVALWDLYNAPGRSGLEGKSLPLVEAAFRWARAVNPSQPLTAGLRFELGAAACRRIMESSDVISFDAYDTADDLEAKLILTEARGRPVLCTGWLRRGRGNTFANILPVFGRHRVGWFHWGLVAGRSQLYMPWDSKKGDPMPKVWEQDVLNEKGEPFDESEVELLKGFAFGVQ